MRSVVVVFPASICAAIPILRVFSSAYSLGMRGVLPVGESLPTGRQILPTIVSECLVGFRHAMAVLALLHRRPLPIRGVQKLASQLLPHRPTRPAPRELHQPANPQGLSALRTHLDRHLIR